MPPIPVDPPDFARVGDFEIEFVVSGHHGVYTVDRSSRGARRTLASFRHRDDALKLVVLLVGAGWRSSQGLSSLAQRKLSSVTTLSEGPTAIHLEWQGGSADFAVGYMGLRNAHEFSHLVYADVADIAQSFDTPDGAPLFTSATT